MKPNIYRIVSECVEVGARRGVNRSFKYTDNPDMETIINNVDQSIMGELCEWFTFQENEDGSRD